MQLELFWVESDADESLYYGVRRVHPPRFAAGMRDSALLRCQGLPAGSQVLTVRSGAGQHGVRQELTVAYNPGASHIGTELCFPFIDPVRSQVARRRSAQSRGRGSLGWGLVSAGRPLGSLAQHGVPQSGVGVGVSRPPDGSGVP